MEVTKPVPNFQSVTHTQKLLVLWNMKEKSNEQNKDNNKTALPGFSKPAKNLFCYNILGSAPEFFSGFVFSGDIIQILKFIYGRFK